MRFAGTFMHAAANSMLVWVIVVGLLVAYWANYGLDGSPCANLRCVCQGHWQPATGATP